MYIPDFKYHKPNSLKEACSLLEGSDNAAPLAGGTDLLVEIKQGLRQHNDIVSLAAIDELQLINFENNELHIGAGVTHGTVARSEIISKSFPAIIDAASKIGSEQVRNTGTIGGNICTAASCCDMKNNSIKGFLYISSRNYH
jgi:CO/xanthine dehydrogenase FAD-binding subunit